MDASVRIDGRLTEGGDGGGAEVTDRLQDSEEVVVVGNPPFQSNLD